LWSEEEIIIPIKPRNQKEPRGRPQRTG